MIFSTCNASGWGPARDFIIELRDQQTELTAVAVQEHRLEADWAAEATRSLATAGIKAAMVPCFRTGAGTMCTSAGVAICTMAGAGLLRGHRASWDLSPPGCSGRLIMAWVVVPGIGAIAYFSVYMWTGEGLTARNAAILKAPLDWVSENRCLWIAAGDWQMEPAALQGTLWVQWLAAVIVAPSRATCRATASGTESTIDWFLLHRDLAPAVEDVTTMEEAAT